MAAWRFRALAFWPLAMLLLLLAGAASANVEKTIFVAGEASKADDLAADSLLLDRLPRLTPDRSRNAWRTHVPAKFPWADNFPANATTWILLDQLRPGRKYELRVCWAATQPTAFSVHTFDAATVVANQTLAASLERYLASLAVPDRSSAASFAPPSLPSTSLRLLQIVSASDYVAADRALMKPDYVLHTLIDVILDPCLVNIVPRSLVPTILAIASVATLSALLGLQIVRWLRMLAAEPSPPPPLPAKNGRNGHAVSYKKKKL